MRYEIIIKLKKIKNIFYAKLKSCMIAFAHFKTIKDDPGKFILWILTSVLLSLSTVWIPSLVGILIGKDFFAKLMLNNPFIVFSVVFLSNSVLTSINYIGAGTNKNAVSLRGITLVITFLYLLFLSSIIPLKLLLNVSLDTNTQFTLLLITIFIGIYVYGLREANWEKTVDEFKKKQDLEVTGIVNKASELTNDGNDTEV
ncbi:MAG: hypothetical protein V4572_04735 [Bacteroidota bacterium]